MVTLREVKNDDVDLLFNWANDPTTRENSFNAAPIPYEHHVKWFDYMMKDPDVLQFIMMNGDIPIGQIRLNVNGEIAEVGYSIGAEFRGKGYGHKILQLTEQMVKQQYPKIKRLVAKVKKDNIGSNHLFEKEGYDLKYLCYTLEIE